MIKFPHPSSWIPGVNLPGQWAHLINNLFDANPCLILKMNCH